ncbi:hypothetical protein FRX31_032899 [Thalictrum thalictroides]|uniref:S-acyltransferase n=1 Tax=Thalictrum thalictroides TaxID=46969 RepID=A0A7J6UZR7_THATH|nr:hypothetical protein FRX31_032899 [Thalictrum thalictroides]
MLSPLGFCRNTPWKFASSSIISFIFVAISQFSLTLIPHYFSSFSLLAQLSLSAVLLLAISGLGKTCRLFLFRVHALAPAFVFFNILFIWGVHVTVVRKEISYLWSIVFNAECVLLIFGLYSIVYGDPGHVAYKDGTVTELLQNEFSDSISDTEEHRSLKLDAFCEQDIPENSVPMTRIRYCKYCRAYIRGFDHHCPAFGNCIGQKNHLLFMALLVGFVMVEASYIACSTQFITKSKIRNEVMLESTLFGNLAISTRLFSILQVLWQVLFLYWHLYCICVNIKTDEWINWNKYPEFQNLTQFHPEQSYLEPCFRNPYDKGVLTNIKEFLSLKE